MDNEQLKVKPQRILVFQQKGSGENKIRGIRQYGCGRFVIQTYDIDAPLPVMIEDSNRYLPETIDADLVLDYLHHPDLSGDLWSLCEKRGVPIVASNKKGTGGWVITPRTCCALPRMEKLGEYARFFGAPEFQVRLSNGRVAGISVLRGSPCGATWEAARQTIGIPVEEASVHIGLKAQYYCTADPADWDVLHGRSPLHFSAELHKAALKKAMDRLEYIS